jgi:ATP-dependent DNA helicase RecG
MHDFLKQFLFTSIATMDGIGEKRAALYNNIGVSNIRDLLLWLPSKVICKEVNPGLHKIASGMHVVLDMVVEDVDIPYSARGPCKVRCSATHGGFGVELVYFSYNKAQIANQFSPGSQLVVDGILQVIYGSFQIVHPSIVVTPAERFKIWDIEPVYPVTKGLTTRIIGLGVRKALGKMPEVEEWIPQDMLAQNAWPGFKKALELLHIPQDKEEVKAAEKARDRLVFDEMLHHQVALNGLRLKTKAQVRDSFMFNGALKEKMLTSLSFTPTACQLRVVAEIENDLRGGHKTVRLLQGDVGAGKTLVAMAVMLNVVEAGCQAAIMVPTELLAIQHFSTMQKLAAEAGVEVQLLISKLPAAKRRAVIARVASGEAKIIIGTHVLIQQEVMYHNLRYVIVDEQHRFGVLQRQALMHKAQHADLLMMTATPIPRTLEMAIYGDMAVSYLRTKPAQRKEIVTSVMSHKKLPELMQAIKAKVGDGQKVYWVCPLIEQSESVDISYVQQRFEMLSEMMPNMVGYIHGKMKQAERDEVMQQFIAGTLLVVVATTVIEVGVDVRDATVMVIENAERFGLAQLHQLRGRVGRGDLQSYCILVYGTAYGKTSQQRLQIMKESTDGFMIAEKDLQLRRAGDIVGLKQSGDLEFKVFNFERDQWLIQAAFELSRTALDAGVLRIIFRHL